MKVSEFRAKINEAEEILKECDDGVCDSLFTAFGVIKGEPEVAGVFDDLLSPYCTEWGIDGNVCYWLGNLTKENLPLRIHF